MNIVFMGTPDFSVPILDRLVGDGYDVCAVVTQPDRPKGRKKKLTPPPVKVAAEKYQIPVLQPEKLKEETSYEQVLQLEPDLIVTAAYGQLLPSPLLRQPQYGCINVHASLLPKYRGGAPIHQAIIDGEDKTGITIMYMVEKLDAGDMISQRAIPIEEEDTVGTLHDKLSKLGAELLSETIPQIVEQSITPIPQNDEEATFAPNIQRSQEKIDWNKDGEDVYNLIRGLNPWPVAFTHYEGRPLKIWWGEKVPTNESVKGGTIISLEGGIVVACGNHIAIRITELQPAGKKRMKATDFLKGAGAHLTKGDHLGT